MGKYSLYLFDFDGTLFDTLPSLIEVYRLSLLHFGYVPKKEEYPKFLGLSLPLTAKACGIKDEDIKSFVDLFHELVNDRKVVENTRLYPDTLATFKYLKDNNIKFGVVSGSATKRIHDIFDYFNLDFNALQVCVGNDVYKKAKPDADPILTALDKVGYLDKKDQVLYIGDAKQDALCSEAAGVDYVIVKRGDNGGTIKSLLDAFKL